MASNDMIEGKPLPLGELLAAMIIYLLPVTSTLATTVAHPEWMDTFLLVLFWGAVLLALGLAIIKGLPPWSLTYLGFLSMWLVIFSRYDRVWSWIYPIFIQLFGPRSNWSIPIRISYYGIFATIMLSLILLIGLILVNLLRVPPHTRGVWQGIRADWTQLSYLYYGGLVVAVMVAFDEYHHDNIWKLIAWTCLALGAWSYLRAKGSKRRILSIFLGATGAMWTVALAKWMLIPLQAWPTGYPVSPSEVTRWVETSGAIIGWVLILIMLLAPALLNLLPRTPKPVLPKGKDSVSTTTP
ncbi:MAG: hypothetical protein PVF74_02080 [Anaerolineales bacterium]|jgi:hypothetical protein